MKRIVLLFLFFALPALGQNTRWDSVAATTGGVGTLVPILAMPGSSVAFFNACTSDPCSPTRATTYTSANATTTCPTGAQVVWQLPYNQACTSYADSRGEFGGYFQPGAYEYTVSQGGLTYGPYYFTVSSESGLPDPVIANSIISKKTPVYNVLGYNAKGDGSTDDTQSIATAAAACGVTGGTLLFPAGTTGAFTTTQTVTPPGTCDVEIDGTLKATASMSAVLNIGGNGRAQLGHLFGNGVIDSNNLASRHIYMTNYNVFDITGITLLNTASIAGIDIGKSGAQSQAGAYIHDMTLFVPVGTASIPGSVGIWEDTGTDASIGPNIVITGYDISARDSVGGNQPWKDIHAYGTSANNLPSTCFDSVAGSAHWVNDECDTPTVIGIHAHGFNDQIDHYRCFNNNVFGTDNVVNCVQFDQSTPFSSVTNSLFKGQDSSHRLAADVAVTSMAAVTSTGNEEQGNVVIQNASGANFRAQTNWNTFTALGNIVFQNGATPFWTLQKSGSTFQLFDNGGSMSRFDVVPSAAMSFENAGTNPFNFVIGGQTIGSINPTTTTLSSHADTGYNFDLDSGATATQNDNIQFRDQGSPIWFFSKDSSNNLVIFDQLMNADRMVMTQNGGMSITNNGGSTFNNVSGNYNFEIASTRYLTLSTAGVQIGTSGSFMAAQYKGTGTLTYGSITAPGCQEQPITINGTAAGDACYASTGATDVGTTFYYGGCRISAANTAQIKVCATATGTPTTTGWTVWATH